MGAPVLRQRGRLFQQAACGPLITLGSSRVTKYFKKMEVGEVTNSIFQVHFIYLKMIYI